MKASCPAHGEYTLFGTFPECPRCIQARMKFPNGDDPKHSITGAQAAKGFASYKADGVDSVAVFDYMATGAGVNPSGCQIFYHTGEQSFNAVSFEPLGQIPGSGVKKGTGFACQLAVLQDIQGKSNKGPHWAYEDIPHFNQRLAKGEWVLAARCISCGVNPVYSTGDKCPVCISPKAASGIA